MDGIFPKTGRDDSTRAEAKWVWLRLGVFILVLFTSHSLMMWLRPLGAHPSRHFITNPSRRTDFRPA